MDDLDAFLKPEDDQRGARAQLQFQEFNMQQQQNIAELHVDAYAKNQSYNVDSDVQNENNENLSTGPSFWSFKYYQQLFNVNTAQVRTRLINSMIPTSSNRYLQNIIRPSPDLYGPLWICVTLIFAIAVSKNLVSYHTFLEKLTTSNKYHWQYDFHTVSYAAAGIFSYVSLIPLLLSGLLWLKTQKSSLTFLEILCLYGYSLCIFIPVVILWAIPISLVQWILLLISTIISASVLVANLLPDIKEAAHHLAFPLSLAILILHILLPTIVMLMYFHETNNNNGSMSTTAHHQTSEAPRLNTTHA